MPDDLFRVEGKTEIGVHPLAAIFPMLSDEELAELAADIKENGQLHPIICTVDGKLIVDGRNRIAACKIAGVEPWFENRICSEEEARALIVSANLQRRNMTKGQQAMALAMIHPEPAKRGGTKDRGSMFGDQTLVTRERLSLARAVYRASPDVLAPVVLSGAMSLDAAILELEARRREAESDTVRIARLRNEAPDIADLVLEERLGLEEAIAALDKRIAEAKRVEASKRDTIYRTAEAIYSGTRAWAVDDFIAGVGDRIADPEFRDTLLGRLRLDPNTPTCDEIMKGAASLCKIINYLMEHKK